MGTEEAVRASTPPLPLLPPLLPPELVLWGSEESRVLEKERQSEGQRQTDRERERQTEIEIAKERQRHREREPKAGRDVYIPDVREVRAVVVVGVGR